MMNQVLIVTLALVTISCGDDAEKKKTKVTTNVRSTGATKLSLNEAPLGLVTESSFLANSTVTVDSFKVPIGRINLTAGDTGSGYTSASPNFYGCKGTTNAECMVDVVRTSIKDLLAYASAEREAEKAAKAVESSNETKSSDPQEIELAAAATYTGTAVEICAEGRPEGNTFKAKLKASGVLGSTTYYTNKASGVSTSGPAEEVEISMSCMGRNTDLIRPIELVPEQEATLVFWAEPAGSVLITNNAPLINSNCTSSQPGDVAFCATLPPFFGTTTAGDAKAERFLLDVTTKPTSAPSETYADIVATAVFDADGVVFGGLMRQTYSNTAGERKLMHAPEFEFSGITEADSKLTFKYLAGANTTEQVDLLSGLPRKTAGTNLSISKLVEEAVTVNSTPLQ